MKSAPKLTPRTLRLAFEGRNYPLVLDARGWRLRSRSASHAVDYRTNTTNVVLAKRLAKAHLESLKLDRPKPQAATLEDVVKVYKEMPKRAGARAELYNITMLRFVVRTAWGRELRQVRVHEVGPRLWAEFMAARQGGRLDLATRRPAHTSINSSVRAAASVFIKGLRPVYAERGLMIPDQATGIRWLQEISHKKAPFDDSGLLSQWREVKDRALWFCIGLARFAGLRRNEILYARGSWLEQQKGRWGIRVCDRPNEGFYCKTGEPRFAPLLDGALIEALQMIHRDDFIVFLTGSRAEWFERKPQAWLRQFMASKADIAKPLHRLRGLYLDAFQESEETRIQDQALLATAAAAGHTSTSTTRLSYLSAS